MRPIIIICFICLVFANGYSQSCNNYHLRNCEGCGDPFKYSGQSKSTTFEKGQISQFHITVYEGFEYCVQISADKNLKGISFKIKEDDGSQGVLYDSAVDDNNYLEKAFYVTKSRKLIIEVAVPESEVDVTQVKYNELSGCVGVLIEYNRPQKKGFEKKPVD